MGFCWTKKTNIIIGNCILFTKKLANWVPENELDALVNNYPCLTTDHANAILTLEMKITKIETVGNDTF